MPFNPYRRILVLFGMLAAMLLAVAPADAQVLPPPAAPSGNAVKPHMTSSEKQRSTDGRIGVIVTLKPDAVFGDTTAGIRSSQNSVLATLPVSALVVTAYSDLPLISLRVTDTDLEAIKRNPQVESVQIDQIRHMMDSEADLITHAPFVRGLGFTGAGIRAAVIDSGIDTDHPSAALIGDIFFQRCFRSENDCPNGNNVNSAEDENGHGTHVAGIITGSNGVAPDVEVAALKVFTTGDTTDSNILAALNYIIQNDATLQIDMINMSLGGDNYRTEAACNADNAAYKRVFKRLNNLGIAVFVATGNDADLRGVSAPACVTGAIGVGSTNDGNAVFCGDDLYEGVTCFSNATKKQGAGELVDILAPGCSILSEYIGGGYEELCGTSMAAPMALGVAALVKSYANSLPLPLSLTPAQLENVLESSGDRVLDTRNGVSYPVVNAEWAYGSLIAKTPKKLKISAQTGTSTTLTWRNLPDETGFVVERSNDGGKFVVVGSTIQDIVTLTDGPLACGVLKYRVRSVKGNATGLPSNVVSRKAVTPCPLAPTNLRWSWDSGTNSYVLTWTGNAVDATGYVVERSSDGGYAFANHGTTGAGASTFTDNGAGCGEYAYRVYALRSGTINAHSKPSNIVYAGCPPANDLFANAETLSGTSGSDTETAIRYAQVQPGDYVHDCHYSGASTGGATVWYTFTAPTDGHFSVSTENASYDTTISIVTGTPGAFVEVDCNDDIDVDEEIYQSEIDLAQMSSGVTYYVEVSSYQTAGLPAANTLELDWSFVDNIVRPTNDDIASAETVTGATYNDVETAVAYASSEATDPAPSCRFFGANRGSNSLWYTYTPTTPVNADITTNGSTDSYEDTILAVYSGTPGSLIEVACNEDEDAAEDIYTSALKNVELAAGTTYYIYVARWDPARTTEAGTMNIAFAFEENLLRNGDFDGAAPGGVPASWTRAGNGSANDKRVCTGVPAQSLPCVYQFKGGAGESSTLTQKINAARLASFGLTYTAGDTFNVSLSTSGLQAAGSLKLTIAYSDGTPSNTASVAITPSAAMQVISQGVTLNSSAVAKVTVQIKSTASSGKTFVDDAVLTYIPAGPRAERGDLGDMGAILPPPIADGFRGGN